MKNAKKYNDFHELLRSILIYIGIAIGMLPLTQEVTAIALIVMILAPIVLLIYFLPSLTALKKNKANSIAILTLNLTLGWTLVFWVVALIWSYSRDFIDPLFDLKQATYHSGPKAKRIEPQTRQHVKRRV